MQHKEGLQISKHSGIYRLETEQIIPGTIEEVWDFFSSPKNLQALTPEQLKFVITSPLAEKVYAGQIISYKISIFPIIDTNWVTEITHVMPLQSFIDEQRFGPYAMWHHEHHFQELSGNRVLMKDIVHYKLPLGMLGNALAGGIIKRQVSEIFSYRRHAIQLLFSNK